MMHDLPLKSRKIKFLSPVFDFSIDNFDFLLTMYNRLVKSELYKEATKMALCCIEAIIAKEIVLYYPLHEQNTVSGLKLTWG